MKKLLLSLGVFALTITTSFSIVACTPKDEVGLNQDSDGVLTLEEYTNAITELNETKNQFIRTWPLKDYKINVNSSDWEIIKSGKITDNVKFKIMDRFVTLIGGEGFWHYSEKTTIDNLIFDNFIVTTSSKSEEYDFSVDINFKESEIESTKITGKLFNYEVDTQTDLNKSSFEKSISLFKEVQSEYGVNSNGYFLSLDFIGKKDSEGKFDTTNYVLTYDLETLNINYMNMWMRNLNIYDQFLNPSAATFSIDWQSGWLKPGTGISVSEDGTKIFFNEWKYNSAVSLTNIGFQNSNVITTLTGSYLNNSMSY